ncbi:MAG: hypothetical protein ACOY4K_00625 [Pseudomonadota bacterium]
MNRPTGTDMCFVAGVLIGLGVAVLAVFAGALWAIRTMIGG